MAAPPDDFQFPIDGECNGQRLDVALTALLPGCSRSYAAQLIRSGAMVVNHERRKPSYRLVLGDVISGRLPEREPSRFLPEPMALDIIHEDADVIVLNKPAGLVVHPAPGHASGTLVNGLLAHCPALKASEAEVHRPGIVHRLDKDTSGVMVVAKNRRVHEALAHQFKQRLVRKHYLAIVRGRPPEAAGEIDLPIGRHSSDRKKMSITTRRGRPALTSWTLRTAFDGAALLVLELKTGRTHQARVHCAAMRHPILGDPVYGPRRHGDAVLPDQVKQALKSAGRQMLHAWRLSFHHPAQVQDREVTFEAALPDDMQRVLNLLSGIAPNACGVAG